LYREALGLPVVSEWEWPSGRGAILDAGRATVELVSVKQTELVDEVEVGSQGSPDRRASHSRRTTRSETAVRLVAAITSGERPW
jgi:hypothetical protein